MSGIVQVDALPGGVFHDVKLLITRFAVGHEQPWCQISKPNSAVEAVLPSNFRAARFPRGTASMAGGQRRVIQVHSVKQGLRRLCQVGEPASWLPAEMLLIDLDSRSLEPEAVPSNPKS